MIKELANIPTIYWLILIMSTLIHLLMKIQLDARENKIAAKAMFTGSTLLTIIISILCSITCLVIGYSGYEQWLIKHPDSDNPFLAGLVVALIGYSSSSFFLNLMKLTEDKVFSMLGFNKKDNENDTPTT